MLLLFSCSTAVIKMVGRIESVVYAVFLVAALSASDYRKSHYTSLL